MGWIVLGVVVVAVGVVYVWAGRHSKVRADVRLAKYDEAVKHPEVQAQQLRDIGGTPY